MPTYDYKCAACGTVFEVFHGMQETPQLSCPNCGAAEVNKQIGSGAGIIFKGSGFYVTDYKKGGSEQKSTKPEAPAATATAEKTHTCSGACSH